MQHLVMIHPAEEGGYWAEVPLLPGCYGQGETLEEVLTDIKDAISSHIEALAESGEAAPSQDVILSMVHVPAA